MTLRDEFASLLHAPSPIWLGYPPTSGREMPSLAVLGALFLSTSCPASRVDAASANTARQARIGLIEISLFHERSGAHLRTRAEGPTYVVGSFRNYRDGSVMRGIVKGWSFTPLGTWIRFTCRPEGLRYVATEVNSGRRDGVGISRRSRSRTACASGAPGARSLPWLPRRRTSPSRRPSAACARCGARSRSDVRPWRTGGRLRRG